MSQQGNSVQWIVPTPRNVYRVVLENRGRFFNAVVRVGGRVLNQVFAWRYTHELHFELDGYFCHLKLTRRGFFSYEYSLNVDAKDYEEYCQNIMSKWVSWSEERIVLEWNKNRVYVKGRIKSHSIQEIEGGKLYRFSSNYNKYEIHEQLNHQGLSEFTLHVGANVLAPDVNIFEVQPNQ